MIVANIAHNWPCPPHLAPAPKRTSRREPDPENGCRKCRTARAFYFGNCIELYSVANR